MTLPAKPKAFGNLRHVFKSSLAAVGFAVDNPLDFKATQSLTVVFVDGLGTHQIKQRAGHSPFLASQHGNGYAVFPSTTACGITSFATGLWPGEHGVVGHQAFDSSLALGGNMLTGWGAGLEPRAWQQQPPLSELATAAGIPVRVISHSEYRSTGFTEITMRGADFTSADRLDERFEIALDRRPGVSYLYVAELDKLAHRFGWESRQWVEAYESVSTEIEKLVSRRGDMGVVVTADHGLIDTEPDRRVFLEAALSEFDLKYFGGDTRVAYLYLDAHDPGRLRSALEPFSHALTLHGTEELVEAGYFGPLAAGVRQRLPEVVLMARSNYTLFHAGFSKPKSSEMIAHHGGLSPAETQIPIFRFGV